MENETQSEKSAPVFVTNELSDCLLKVRSVPSRPLITKGMPGTEKYIYGLEGGRVLRQGDSYYLFVTEMNGQPAWVKTSLGLWKSHDGYVWGRVRTIAESTGTHDGTDRRASLWAPIPTFDEVLNRWIVTYTCYTSMLIPGVSKNGRRCQDGEIAWAVSKNKGESGIDAEYEDQGVLISAGTHSMPWEGRLGVGSFFPYKVADRWYALYGSSPENIGGAYSESNQLTSGWMRFPTVDPLLTQVENPVIFKIKPGLYLTLYDGCSEYQAIGYMFSTDGLVWSKPQFLSFEGFDGKWFELTRTPVGLFSRDDGLWDLYFTAYNANWYEVPSLWDMQYKEPDTTYNGYFASFGVMQIEIISGGTIL